MRVVWYYRGEGTGEFEAQQRADGEMERRCFDGAEGEEEEVLEEYGLGCERV